MKILITALAFSIAATTFAAEAPSFQNELDALTARSVGQVPPEIIQAGLDGTEELRTSGILDKALGVGATMPHFELKDAHGEAVDSKALLAQGPLVVTFYRGAWCPYCNLYLRGLERSVSEFDTAGASLLAISSEPQDRSLTVEESNELSYLIASDPKLEVASKFGIVYKLPTVIDDAIKSVGFDMAAYQDREAAHLPLAATYVVDRGGIIRYAFLDADYKNRAEPSDILEALKKLN